MSFTKSIEFYAGKKCIKTNSFFGGTFLNYEFHKDIAYTDLSFAEVSNELRNYMVEHDIKIGYCDISGDFGGGYSLIKRYVFVNKDGTLITQKQKYVY